MKNRTGNLLHVVADRTGESEESFTALIEKQERQRLNILLGMPRWNHYPAFREGLSASQVHSAVSLLEQSVQPGTAPEEARALRYQAERVIYPHQSGAAIAEGWDAFLDVMKRAA